MLYHYLGLGAVLFAIGVIGVLIRRNVIVVLMCVELMLNAVNLTILAFSRQLAGSGGFEMAMNGHAAVGLAIVISLYRRRQTVDVEEINLLKW